MTLLCSGYGNGGEGEGEELDLMESLRTSLEQGGIPELIYCKQRVAAQYLVLIDQQSSGDQLARYYQDLVWEMQKRDITAEFYFYDRSPWWCWKQRNDPASELDIARLAAEYGNYRLLLVGDGHGLLDDLDGHLREEARVFRQWPVRALLSTSPPGDWSRLEDQLEQLFPVILPATPPGIGQLVRAWDRSRDPLERWTEDSLGEWRRDFPESAPVLERASMLEELRAYLGEKGFQWLCACALFPQLHYELSLHYGDFLGLLQGENHVLLIRLLRLPWFRQGSLPAKLRVQLCEQLDPDLAKKVRSHLQSILRQDRNQAPEGSYARQGQQLTLALYQYLNSSRNKSDLHSLRQHLKQVDPHGIRDAVSLQHLSSISPGPFRIILPRNFFEGEIRMFGTKWITRLGMALLAIGVFWGIYLGLGYSPYPTTSRPNPYESQWSGLWVNLDNWEDSVKWTHYKVWWANRGGYLATARYDLSEIRKASTLIDTLTSFHQSVIAFNQAVSDYEQGNYIQAKEGFESCCPEYLHLDATYAQGLAHLMSQQIPEAIMDLSGADSSKPASLYLLDFNYAQTLSSPFPSSRLFKPNVVDGSYYQDTSIQSWYVFNHAIARAPLTALLQDAYQRQDSTSRRGINRLLRWLDAEIRPLDQLLAAADAVFQAQDWAEALRLYEQILIQEQADAPAIAKQRRSICKSRLEQQRQDRIARLIVRGDSLYALLQWEAAMQAYAEWLELDPGNRTARNKWNAALLASKRNPGKDSIPAIVVKKEPGENRKPNPPEKIKDPNDTPDPTRQQQQPKPSTSDGPQGKFTVGRQLLEGYPLDVYMRDKDNFLQEEESFLLLDEKKSQFIHSNLVERLEGNKMRLHFPNLLAGKTYTLMLFTGRYDDTRVGYPVGWIEVLSARDVPIPAMTYVEGGEFVMKKSETDSGQVVSVGSFEIGTFELTNEEFLAFLEARYDREVQLDIHPGFGKSSIQLKGDDGGPDEPPRTATYFIPFGFKKYPVDYVSLGGASEYCLWLSEITGEVWRLPTETEWVYAAKGGNRSKGFRFAGSNDLEEVAWTDDQPHRVGRKRPNELGLYDMNGNVEEWKAESEEVGYGYGFRVVRIAR